MRKIVFLFFVVFVGCATEKISSPTIVIEQPADGSNILNPFIIKGTAQDPSEIELVQIRFDDKDYKDAEGKENWHLIMNTTEKGSHFITVKATNKHGFSAYNIITVNIIDTTSDNTSD